MVTPIILLAVIGCVAAVILVIASKVMYVPVDQTVLDIRDVLPGANCGACGFAGCDDYAAALAKDPKGVLPTLCIPGGGYVASSVARILGVDAGAVTPQKAFIRCQGNAQNKDKVIRYVGLRTCAAEKQFYGGQWSCSMGCLGMGDCSRKCPYGAITIINNLPEVDHSLCVGCGLCAQECPNHIITINDFDTKVMVTCSSHYAGKKVMNACKTACIGCKKCEKACVKFNAIVVEDNLPKIDYDKCVGCGLCAKECPTGAIVVHKKKKKEIAAS